MIQRQRYKDLVINQIKKTDCPVAPIAFQNLFNGIDQVGKIIAHLCDKEKALLMQDRLMKDFSNEELDGIIGESPELLLSLLAMVKESSIRFSIKK